MVNNGTVLVTGASGFIGGHLAELFHVTGMRSVRAGIRRWSSCARLGRFPIEMVQLDLLDDSTLAPALRGVSHVIHCAQGPGAVIVEGTRNLLAACLKAGIRSVVHLSSAAVYGDATGDVDEDHPLCRTDDEYANAKIDAEDACREASVQGLPLVILRPPIVYGPFSMSWTVDLATKLATGRWRTFGRMGEGTCNLLFVSDLCRAILAVLDNPRAHGQVFNINGPETLTWNEYFRRVNRGLDLPDLRECTARGASARARLIAPLRAMGRHVRDHHLDTAKRLAACFHPAKRLMKGAERVLRVTPTSSDLALYSRDVVYSAAKARRLLGFTPKFGVDEGLGLTSEWLRGQGLV